MRLATYFLIVTLFVQSNAEGILPWKNAKPLPWQITKPGPIELPYSTPGTPCYLPIKVFISPNGAIKITGKGGRILLRLGLPGRPQKVWRDCGNIVTDIFSPISFPMHPPPRKRSGDLLTDVLDFRPNLEGLLWIIDDDESVLTIISPATSQVVYLSLPAGQDLTLSFHPDHIEIIEGLSKSSSKERVSWSLYWLTLVPHFIQLRKCSDHQQKQKERHYFLLEKSGHDPNFPHNKKHNQY